MKFDQVTIQQEKTKHLFDCSKIKSITLINYKLLTTYEYIYVLLIKPEHKPRIIQDMFFNKCILYYIYVYMLLKLIIQFGTPAASLALRSFRNILPEGDLGITSMKKTRFILL